MELATSRIGSSGIFTHGQHLGERCEYHVSPINAQLQAVTESKYSVRNEPSPTTALAIVPTPHLADGAFVNHGLPAALNRPTITSRTSKPTRAQSVWLDESASRSLGIDG
jgi:hypothetical protein